MTHIKMPYCLLYTVPHTVSPMLKNKSIKKSGLLCWPPRSAGATTEMRNMQVTKQANMRSTLALKPRADIKNSKPEVK